MRIVSWTLEGRHRRDAVATVLRRLSPDIVCLPSAPSVGRLRRVARASGLNVISVEGSGPRSAILAADDLRQLSTGSLTLPTEHPRSPDRSVAQAILGVGGQRYAVAACQLGAQRSERMQHTERVLNFLDSLAAPAVLGLDANTSPRGDAVQMLLDHYKDAWASVTDAVGATYPTPDPSTRRDLVILDENVEVEACHVDTEPPVDSSSLHRPVVVDVAD